MLLHKENYLDKVKEIISSDIDIAVAYWGEGSSMLLENTDNARIICNLFSNGTSIDEIKKIQALSKSRNIEIRHYPYLHAKTIISKDCAVIGSANFSNNGLGIFTEQPRQEELGAVCDKEIAKEAKSWFENIWEKSGHIDEKTLKLAENFHISTNHLFEWEDIFNSNNYDAPDLTNLKTFIAVYDRSVTDKAKSYGKKAKEAGLIFSENDIYEGWDYEDCKMQDGQIIIDLFWKNKNQRPECGGIWRIFANNGKTGDDIVHFCRREVNYIIPAFNERDCNELLEKLKPALPNVPALIGLNDFIKILNQG